MSNINIYGERNNSQEILSFNGLPLKIKIKIFFEVNQKTGINTLKSLDSLNCAQIRSDLGQDAILKILSVFIQTYANSRFNQNSNNQGEESKLSALIDPVYLEKALVKDFSKLLSKLIQTKDVSSIIHLLKNPAFSVDSDLMDWILDTKDIDLVRQLLQHSNFKDKQKFDWILHEIINCQSTDLIQLLFYHQHFDLSSIHTILFAACETGHIESLDLALAHAFFDDQDPFFREEVVKHAVELGMKKRQQGAVIHLLGKEGLSLNNETKQTLLFEAAAWKCLKVVEKFLDDPSIDVCAKDYHLFFILAREDALETILKILDGRKIDINRAVEQVLMSVSASEGSANVIKYFLESSYISADANLDKYFFKSCKNGNAEVVKLFLNDKRINFEDTIEKALLKASKGKNLQVSLHEHNKSDPAGTRAAAAKNEEATATLLNDQRFPELEPKRIMKLLSKALFETSQYGILSIAKLLVNHPRFVPTEVLASVIEEAIKRKHEDYFFLMLNYILFKNDYDLSSGIHLQKALNQSIDWLTDKNEENYLDLAIQKNFELGDVIRVNTDTEFFQSLPNEIIYKIFEHLDAQNLLNFNLVDKRSQHLSNSKFNDTIDKYSFVADLIERSPESGFQLFKKFNLDINQLMVLFSEKTINPAVFDRFLEKRSIYDFLLIMIFYLNKSEIKHGNSDLLKNRFITSCMNREFTLTKKIDLKWMNKTDLNIKLKKLFNLIEADNSQEETKVLLHLHHLMIHLGIEFIHDLKKFFSEMDIGRIVQYLSDVNGFKAKLSQGSMLNSLGKKACLLDSHKDLWIFELLMENTGAKLINLKFDKNIQFFGKEIFSFLKAKEISFFITLRDYFLLDLDLLKNKQDQLLSFFVVFFEFLNKMPLSSDEFKSVLEHVPLIDHNSEFRLEVSCQIINILYEIFYVNLKNEKVLFVIENFVDYILVQNFPCSSYEFLKYFFDFSEFGDREWENYYSLIFKSLFSNMSSVVLESLVMRMTKLDQEKIDRLVSYISELDNEKKLDLSTAFVKFINQKFKVISENEFEVRYRSSKIELTIDDGLFFNKWKKQRYNGIFKEIISIFTEKASECLEEKGERYLEYLVLASDLVKFIPGEDKIIVESLIQSVKEYALEESQKINKKQLETEVDYYAYESDYASYSEDESDFQN